MANIKIERSQRQVADYKSPQLGALALSENLALVQQQAFTALGVAIKNVAEKTKNQEDKNQFRKLKLSSHKKISEALSKYERSTDISELNNLFTDLNPKEFADILKNQNDEVKLLFNNYLYDIVDKNYADIYSKIISNFTEETYAGDLDDIMDWDRDEASPDFTTSNYGYTQKKIWFNDIENKKRYSDTAFMKLQDDSKLRTLNFQLGLKTKNDPFSIYELGKKLEPILGVEGAIVALNNSENAIVSNYIEENRIAEIKEKADVKQKVSNFSYVLDNLFTGNEDITIDDINDLFKADQINSAQRNTLYRVKLGDIKPSSENILHIINGAIHSAETVEDWDLIENTVLTSHELADHLGIKDFEKYINIFNKYKTDRPGFIAYQRNRKLLDADLGKVELASGFLFKTAPSKPDEKVRILGLDYYDGLIRQGYNAEDAYAKTAEKYLDNKNVPDIYNIAVTTSVRVIPPTTDELKAGKVTPETYFNNYRKEAAKRYEITKNLEEYSADISSLDTMEDMFYIRKELFRRKGNDGVAEAFSETNPSDTEGGIEVKDPPK